MLDIIHRLNQIDLKASARSFLSMKSFLLVWERVVNQYCDAALFSMSNPPPSYSNHPKTKKRIEEQF